MFAFSTSCPARLIRRLLAAALLAHVAGPLRADEPLSLREAQQLAVARSGQLLAQNAAARAARDMAVAAGQLPDPVLKLGIDNLPVTGPDRLSISSDFMTMRRIGLMQEITRSDKRQLRSERFEREAERVQAQRQLTRATIERDTTLAWLDRYYAQAMRTLLLQQLDETRLQEQGALLSFRQGRGPQADVFAARSALIEVEDRLSQTDRQVRNASLMLTRWIGDAADRPLAKPPTGQTSAFENARVSRDLQHHPQLALPAALMDTAETEARLAQANTRSDWTVEAAYQQRGPAYSNMVSIGVSIPLQWDQKNRQSRELAARLALVDEARANYEDALRSHEAELRSLLNDWKTSKERVTRYTGQMVPVAVQRATAALTSYRTGQRDLSDVLTARREEINTRLQALSLELETARLWAQLNYLAPYPQSEAMNPGGSGLPPTSSKGQP